jgi:hypothetical protein
MVARSSWVQIPPSPLKFRTVGTRQCRVPTLPPATTKTVSWTGEIVSRHGTAVSLLYLRATLPPKLGDGANVPLRKLTIALIVKFSELPELSARSSTSPNQTKARYFGDSVQLKNEKVLAGME